MLIYATQAYAGKRSLIFQEIMDKLEPLSENENTSYRHKNMDNNMVIQRLTFVRL